MVIIRILVVAAAIVLGFGVLMYVITGQPAWRRFTWRAFTASVLALVVVLLLFALEHLWTQA